MYHLTNSIPKKKPAKIQSIIQYFLNIYKKKVKHNILIHAWFNFDQDPRRIRIFFRVLEEATNLKMVFCALC